MKEELIRRTEGPTRGPDRGHRMQQGRPSSLSKSTGGSAVWSRAAKRARTLMFVLPFWLLGLPAASQAPADEGVSGHLHFSDGTSVAFTHLGRLDRVWEYSVSGYLGGQRVLYSVSDLKEIIFVSRSEDRTGIFVSKTGERFTVTGLYVRVRDDTTVDVAYVYNDPVTGKAHAIDYTRLG